MTQNLPSTKPYLIRAIHEWCTDNGFTPHVAVKVDDRVRVPRGHARDGQIVLNIGIEATGGLRISNDMIRFQARFGGVAHDISFPVGNVVAIYARENGAGMAFEPEGEETDASGSEIESESTSENTPDPDPRTPPTGRPKLQRIK
jgi:stringent starvation protein B